MNIKLKKFIINFFLLTILFSSSAAAKIEIPQPVGYINDFSNVISSQNKQKMNTVILELKQKTGIEIAIVTMDSLKERPIEDIALSIAREWGIGQKDKSNGLLILVAPNERKMRIEIGYGLEGIITDAAAGRIRDNHMLPYFQNNDYDTGITFGTIAVIQHIVKNKNIELTALSTSLETNKQKYTTNAHKSQKPANPLSTLIFFIIFMFFAIKYPRATLFLILMLSSRGRSYGGGGFGGSGFGGFGGGGFGGGGASGRW
ncbi:MAG: TPM domain-containing protein [Bacillota bacterium]